SKHNEKCMPLFMSVVHGKDLFHLPFIMKNSTENKFCGIIIRVVDLLRLSANHTAIWRVCDFEWHRRFKRMSCVHLKIICCTIREIARLYRLIFRGNHLAISTAAEFILLRDLHQMVPLQCLMTEYDECVLMTATATLYVDEYQANRVHQRLCHIPTRTQLQVRVQPLFP
ncbi:hypothetical protein TSAR_002689, partial [Trichomalopsis sarcophagae]